MTAMEAPDPKDPQDRKNTVDEVIRESLRISLELQRQLGRIQQIIDGAETKE